MLSKYEANSSSQFISRYADWKEKKSGFSTQNYLFRVLVGHKNMSEYSKMLIFDALVCKKIKPTRHKVLVCALKK